ncbi:hypothetical protein BD770DRAFT_394904 [Pilaira anomala]|nr:hypothetical protein BD770DRAFT_394904 [Pilaira anomala]
MKEKMGFFFFFIHHPLSLYTFLSVSLSLARSLFLILTPPLCKYKIIISSFFYLSSFSFFFYSLNSIKNT